MTVRVGHLHRWKYDTRWRERKTRPGVWHFRTSQVKSRVGRQVSEAQGAPVGTRFHWGIRAKQVMTKIGPNRYRGGMTGVKTFRRRTKR